MALIASNPAGQPGSSQTTTRETPSSSSTSSPHGSTWLFFSLWKLGWLVCSGRGMQASCYRALAVARWAPFFRSRQVAHRVGRLIPQRCKKEFSEGRAARKGGWRRQVAVPRMETREWTRMTFVTGRGRGGLHRQHAHTQTHTRTHTTHIHTHMTHIHTKTRTDTHRCAHSTCTGKVVVTSSPQSWRSSSSRQRWPQRRSSQPL